MRLELLDDHPPFADIAAAQGAFDAWRAEYNEMRPHQSLDMATPASLFVPRPETVAELVLPPELSVVAGERSPSSSSPKTSPSTSVDEPVDSTRRHQCRRVHPGRCLRAATSRSPSNRSGSGPSGRSRSSRSGPTRSRCTSRWTASTSRPCRRASRSTPCTDCCAKGPVEAGPPPRGPAATGLRAADATLELERTVNGAGLVGLGGKQFSVGIDLAGQRVRIHLQGDVGHVVRDGVIVRSFACALEPSKRQRLQGARLADGTPAAQHRAHRRRPTGVIERRHHRRRPEASTSAWPIASKTVEVLVEPRYLRVIDQGTTIKVVARNTPKEVNRFKASGKAYVS